jgi:hypothetical protein
MKTILFFIALMLYAIFLPAQIDEHTPWTWMKGDNTIDQSGIYGTKGIADVANKPGARNYSTTWRDDEGNLWLFGGTGYAAATGGYLNDLWKYKPSSNTWTWVNGDNVTGQHSVYGIQQTANAANRPGAAFASVSWTDVNGNLWLFGGFGFSGNDFGFLNSLWKYTISTNEWTWIKGNDAIDQVAVYGTQGIADINNNPGARYGSRTWTDATGNLWLYGGYGYDGNNSGILNDVWKYNPSANEWTWIKGDNIIDQTAVYGNKGVSNAANKPGARYVSTSWTDESGNFWMFGGYGYDENNTGSLNDVWKYNTAVNEWTWVNGSNIIDQLAVYGTQGVPDANNIPGARYVSSSWKDPNGEMWLFGGYGFDGINPGYLNDLWKYNPTTNKWTWMKGDNTVDQPGVYGTQGLPAITNKSGARTGSVSWTDGLGNLWLFGGYGFDASTPGVLNDLWKINVFQVLPLLLLHFNGVLNDDAVNLQWKTEQEINFSHYNIQRSFDGINFTSIEKINGKGSSGINDYRWSDNDLKNQRVKKVFYRLQLMDKDGSFTYSKILRFDLNETTSSLTTFPNPAVHSLNLSFNQDKAGKVIFNITDMKGTIVKRQTENITAGRASIIIDVSKLAPAAYLLSVINTEGTALQKFIKQ